MELPTTGLWPFSPSSWPFFIGKINASSRSGRALACCVYNIYIYIYVSKNNNGNNQMKMIHDDDDDDDDDGMG